MIIQKIDIINGAYGLMMISGVTVQPTAENISTALNVADDLAGKMRARGVDIGWQYPTSYGLSNTSDNSGLSYDSAGAFKAVLAFELMPYYGRKSSPEFARIAQDGMETLEHIFVNVPDMDYPETLPLGSGSENSYADDPFYRTPANKNDAIFVYENDILNYSHDFSTWLVDATLVSVTWSSDSTAATIASESNDGTIASAELTFNSPGGATIYITATKTGSTDKFTVTKNFVINDRND